MTGATEGTYTNSPQTTTFVYTKNLTASSDDSDPAQRSTTGNKKLPTTGEKSNNTGLLLGLVLIGISFIFAKRLKKISLDNTHADCYCHRACLTRFSH